MATPLPRRTLRFAVPFIWGAGIIAALYSLQHYNSMANQVVSCGVHESLVNAPKKSSVPLQLVMYVHPHCPCTRASFQELTKFVDRARALGKEPAVEIVVVVASGMPDGWQEGPNVHAAQQFPGASVRYDLGALEAYAQGVTTSGHVVLIDSPARLSFRGGITRSRGHAGDNAGTRAMTEILNGRKPEVAATPVFGCPLFDPEACASLEACRDATPLKSEPSPSAVPHAPVTAAPQ